MAAGNPLPGGAPGKGPLPPGKGKFGAWIKKHPGEAAAAGGVALVGGYALYKSRANASNAAASNGTTGTAGGTSGYVDTGTATPYDYGQQYGGSSGDSADYAGLESQINTLNGQLSKLAFSKNGYLKTVSENGKKNPAPVKVVKKPRPKKPKQIRGKVPSHLRPPIRHK